MKDKRMIVSDAGPLIGLAKTGNLKVLKQLFEAVQIPPSVFEELKISTTRAGADALKEAIEKERWIEVTGAVKVSDILLNLLDEGEAEAIMMAKARGLVLLIDERRGRRVANKEKVKITGTGAVLVAAKRKGIIGQVAPVTDQLRVSGYRLSKSLCKKILKLADEDE